MATIGLCRMLIVQCINLLYVYCKQIINKTLVQVEDLSLKPIFSLCMVLYISVWFLLTTFSFDVNYLLTLSVRLFQCMSAFCFHLRILLPNVQIFFLWDLSFSIFSFSYGFSKYIYMFRVLFFLPLYCLSFFDIPLQIVTSGILNFFFVDKLIKRYLRWYHTLQVKFDLLV